MCRLNLHHMTAILSQRNQCPTSPGAATARPDRTRTTPPVEHPSQSRSRQKPRLPFPYRFLLRKRTSRRRAMPLLPKRLALPKRARASQATRAITIDPQTTTDVPQTRTTQEQVAAASAVAERNVGPDAGYVAGRARGRPRGGSRRQVGLRPGRQDNRDRRSDIPSSRSAASGPRWRRRARSKSN